MKKPSVALLACLAFSSSTLLADVTGKSAPVCELKNFRDASPVDLSRYKGKVIYLDFWASWCGPCAKSMPFMDEMSHQLKSRGLEIVTVNLDENLEDADKFLAQHPASLTVAANPDGQCPMQYELEVMPTSYLIDRQGKIRHVQAGFEVTETGDIRRKVEHLLAEK